MLAGNVFATYGARIPPVDALGSAPGGVLRLQAMPTPVDPGAGYSNTRELGRLLYWNRSHASGGEPVRANRERMRVLATILGLFFAGGLLGAWAFRGEKLDAPRVGLVLSGGGARGLPFGQIGFSAGAPGRVFPA